MSRCSHIAGPSCHAHVDAVPAEGHGLGLEPRALARALGERAVGAHDAVPRQVGIVARVEHRAGEAGRARRHVAVRSDEAGRDGADAGEHRLCTRRHWRHRQSRYAGAVRHGTYSIVARDPDTGEVGVAVQSHWFSVGSIVSWARPGVGAAAARPRFRQVAVVDAAGRVAVHTGDGCIAFAGDQTGDGYSVQANMMASPAVWPAMAEAFESAKGPLSRRLLAALRAAEAAGGDARGRQSAAMVVAPAEGEPWRLSVDLRVEDHPEPLDELERVLDLQDAYRLANRGDNLAGQGRHEEASALYRRAAELAPGSHELLFWSGLAAAQGGDMDTALRRVREAIALQPGWAELLDRLQPDIAPAAPAVRAALRDGA